MSTCPACNAEVLEARDPLDGPVLLGEDGTPHTCPPPRTFVICLPPGTELLTANNRLSRYPKAALVKSLRELGWGKAKELRIPRLGQSVVDAYYHPPAHRGPLCSAAIHDAENIAPSVKALVDGIRQAGVWPQDSVKYVQRVSYQFGPKSERGQLVLHITEVLPGTVLAAVRVPPPGGAA